MIDRLVKNRELLTVMFAFIMIGICLLLGLFLSIEQIIFCIIPILILFIIFTDWLRGLEKAKDFKKFMVFRVIVITISLIFIVIYIGSSYQSDIRINSWYILGWLTIILIGDAIENKYFLKENLDK